MPFAFVAACGKPVMNREETAESRCRAR